MLIMQHKPLRLLEPAFSWRGKPHFNGDIQDRPIPIVGDREAQIVMDAFGLHVAVRVNHVRELDHHETRLSPGALVTLPAPRGGLPERDP
jgi:hypothetical protein